MGRPSCYVLSTLSQAVPHRLGLLQLFDALHQDRHYVTISSPVPDPKFHVALVGRLSVRCWLFRGWYPDGNIRLHTCLLPMVR